MRIAEACKTQPEKNRNVTLIDPLNITLLKPSKPHFSYAKNKVPENLDFLAQQIEKADSYVMVSPEYNHSMRSALADSQDRNLRIDYFGRTFAQLEWWGTAAQNQRLNGNEIQPRAFKVNPSQRNAP